MDRCDLLEADALTFKPIIQKSGFLTTLSDAQFIEFLRNQKKIKVQAGESLLKAGEKGSAFYILIYGRLGVYSADDLRIAEITSGDIIGELAVLIHSPRSHTVRATRDSVLLEIDYRAYLYLENNFHQEILFLAKKSLFRMRNNVRHFQPGEHAKTIAIVPASTSNPKKFDQIFKEHLNHDHKVRLVEESDLRNQFSTSLPLSELDETEIIGWMNSHEDENRFVIYVCDGNNSDWTKRAIRSSDRILLVAESGLSTECNASENYLFSLKDEQTPFIDLVVLFPEGTKNATGVQEWLHLRNVDLCHNVIQNNEAHIQRMVRFVTGKAVGVVLSGGAAKAIGHLGFLKALEEMNITIDYIAGASMGAVIAAGYASYGLEKSLAINKEFISRYSTTPTFPIQSLLTGNREEKLFREQWGDALIENLWLHFFCVASDISNDRLKVFQSKEIWKALKASISIPGVFPPVYTPEGEILVDGGILNNLPVDIMRSRLGGGFIIAVNCNVPRKRTSQRFSKFSSTSSGWRLLFDYLNPFKKERGGLSIFAVIFKSFFTATLKEQLLQESKADVVIHLTTNHVRMHEYRSYENTINQSYRDAKEQLMAVEYLKELASQKNYSQ